jgi:hypothetical protein
MLRKSLHARVAALAGAVAISAAALVAVGASSASADQASDPRAVFVDAANVTTCEAIGLGSDTQIGSNTNANASDANVSGVVGTNSGSVQPGTGDEVNVTILGSNVVIDAVVVKGGNGYNKYVAPSVLPPALQPPQHYISPLNNGGNVPAISHWFVCYHLAETPQTGSLSVAKVVVGGAGQTLPATYNAHVECDDGTTADVTLPGAGGPGSPVVTGIADGATCTVVETTTLPVSSTVTYDPAGVDTTGVIVDAGATPVAVTITNTIPDVAGEVVVKPATAVAVSPGFTG